MIAAIHPNAWKAVLALLTLAVLAAWGWHAHEHLETTASRAMRIGWPAAMGLPRGRVDRLEFLGRCLLAPACLGGVYRPAIASTDPIAGAATGLVLLAAPFWWVLLSPRKRMLYNSRWATLGKLAKVSYTPGDAVLEQGLQVAHTWAHYPELRKNRHGYLTQPSWGERPGPRGGKVIAVTTGERKRELTHTLVVGPTRSGKGLAITQNLLVWTGNAIVNDPKGENHRLTGAFRQKHLRQRIVMIDPRGNGDRFDPFVNLQRHPEGLRAAVNVILESERSSEPIFAQRAASALYAACRAAMLAERSTIPFLRWLTREGLPGFVDALLQLEDVEIDAALADFLGFKPSTDEPLAKLSSDRFLMATWSTLTTKLQPLFSPGVLASSGGHDLDLESLLEQPTTVYLRFGETDLAFTRPYLGLVWLSLVSGLVECADALGRALPIKTLLMLDEAKAVPMPKLADYSSTLAGRGLTAMIFIQDLSQLEAAYSEENAQAIIANCKTHVYFKTPEQRTRKLISERAGKLMIADKHLQKSKAGISVTYRSLERELITPDEVERLHEENVIVFMDNQLPILGRRLNHLEHPLWAVAQDLPALPVHPIQTGAHRPGKDVAEPVRQATPGQRRAIDPQGSGGHLERAPEGTATVSTALTEQSGTAGAGPAKRTSRLAKSAVGNLKPILPASQDKPQ